MMTDEEIVILIQQGIDTKENLEILYYNVEPVLRRTAEAYSSYCEIDDLMQEGFFAVKRAAELWSPDKGASFRTYLQYWLKSIIMRYAARDIDYHDHTKSLDYVLHDDNNGDSFTLGDTIEDEDDPIEDSTLRMEEKELKEKIWELVDTLEDRESGMLHDIYQHNFTLNDCSQKYHLSPDRCGQIKRHGLANMRGKKELLSPYMIDSIESYAFKCSGKRNYKYTGTSCVEKAVIKLYD